MNVGGRTIWIVILFLIVTVAVFFRFASLGFTPPGLYPDEAVNGVNALEAAESGNYQVFYPENNGREGLYINLQAIAITIFGRSVETLRAVSAALGVLAVIGLFFLSRLLWGTRVALLAAYLMAIGFWAVNFSRIGFRAVMLTTVLVWAFYFLWLGLKKQKSWAVVAGGLVFGIGMHSYISFRIAPLILVILFALLWFFRSHPRPLLWRWGILFFVGAIITASPLLFYYAQNPADFMGRASQVSIFEESSPAVALGESVVKTLGMFNVVGDHNWRHNFSGRPLLYWPVGIGFLVGILLLLSRLRQKRHIPEHFLFVWFLIMLIPNFFASEGAPHALRALGSQPAVYIIAALGLVWMYEWIQKRLSRAMIKETKVSKQIGRLKRETAVLAIIVLLFVGVWEGRTYFVKWAFNQNTWGAFTQRLVDAGDFLNISSAGNKYFVVNEGGGIVDGLPIPAMTVKFITWEKREEIRFILPEDINNLPAELSDSVFVFALPEEELRQRFESRYEQAVPIAFPLVNGLRIR